MMFTPIGVTLENAARHKQIGARQPHLFTFWCQGGKPDSVHAQYYQDYVQASIQQFKDFDRRQVHSAFDFEYMDEVVHEDMAADSGLVVPGVAESVIEGLEWLEAERYWEIPAYVVLPNHLHVLATRAGLGAIALDAEISMYKSRVTRNANRACRGRRGSLWCPDVFDHWCWPNREIGMAVAYLRDEPVYSGLVSRAEDWPWMRVP
jgi:REP element-mobilizing transposase RayT